MTIRPPITTPLDYAPAPPMGRKWIRRILSVAVLIAVCFGTWRWGPLAWRQARILYWQRQCMNYTAPADQVVFEGGPAAAANLLNEHKGYAALKYSPLGVLVQGVPAQAAEYVPTCWMRFDSSCSAVTYWTLGRSPTDSVLFLHERVSKGGIRRLVRIQLASWDVGNRQLFCPADCSVECITAGTWRTDPSIVSPVDDLAMMVSGTTHLPNLRIFAGQPDANDASHFTIRYQEWGQEDVMDGWLGDNDYVGLSPRHIPREPN